MQGQRQKRKKHCITGLTHKLACSMGYQSWHCFHLIPLWVRPKLTRAMWCCAYNRDHETVRCFCISSPIRLLRSHAFLTVRHCLLSIDSPPLASISSVWTFSPLTPEFQQRNSLISAITGHHEFASVGSVACRGDEIMLSQFELTFW